MGDGHEALRCSRYSMDSVPPDGHGLVLVSQRLSGAGAEQVGGVTIGTHMLARMGVQSDG